jgi:acetolactate synthase-1/2/3 large subunit
VVGLGGVVPRDLRLKQAHQCLDTATLMRTVAKSSVEVQSEVAIGEALDNAFRVAESPRPGAAFVGLPSDVMQATVPDNVVTPVSSVLLGAGPGEAIAAAAQLIGQAHNPVILIGMLASEARAAMAIRGLLRTSPCAVVTTFQGTGVLSRDMLTLFGGRVGLFHNQPADRLLDSADLVITIGYDPIEYDPSLWNRGNSRPIVHIDAVACDIDAAYKPAVEIIGDIAATINALGSRLQPLNPCLSRIVTIRDELAMIRKVGGLEGGWPVHPLRLATCKRSLTMT